MITEVIHQNDLFDQMFGRSVQHTAEYKKYYWLLITNLKHIASIKYTLEIYVLLVYKYFPSDIQTKTQNCALH